ncbi:MAG: tryptophan-rich sensory protein [Acidobacteriota bacterium]|nr:tryptophan-rich sensory protein [Acidobacteriota bacterium]
MRLTLFFAICFFAAWLGSRFTRPSLAPWYASLAKPFWTPPNWVFGPAWTILFALMAIAGWLVWRQTGYLTLPMVLFALQLVLNVAWSWLFFGMQSPAAGMLEIVFLWLAILATTIVFWRLNHVAGWLFVPYLAWVAYAASLNFAIWRMNA